MATKFTGKIAKLAYLSSFIVQAFRNRLVYTCRKADKQVKARIARRRHRHRLPREDSGTASIDVLSV